jgi:UDP-N-acetylmuramate--alanine ligase
LEAYRDLDDLQDAFVEFVNKVPFYGASVVCLDEERVQDILPRIRRRHVTYGFSTQADVSADAVELSGMSSSYQLRIRGETVGKVDLAVPGRVSVLNSLAAVGVALELNISREQIVAGLEAFSGVDRRFHVKGEQDGILVVDDYGHHPTEIRAVLATAKEAFKKRTVVVFQPHRYTRVQALFDEFCRSFHQADLLLVTEIYPAGESPIPGVTGRGLAEGIEKHGHRDVRFVESVESVPDVLAKELCEGDLVLTLGAGSITATSDRLVETIRERGK